ncbi:MAG: rhodanese-like domain-containing protein [Armatimonadota bacterium]|nr:rhodanese-like domain-containing protein [Armatimonadota bacterium]MDR7518733.1 rhodanese-like domain-containing protein [Armatimonadota bacterium]MDR7551224.1 rhodanese-like domain-containing protein [Armatimonadota bacterium]
MRTLLTVALLVALAAAPTAVAQTSPVQEALFGFLANLPADYHGIMPSALKARLDAGEKPFLLDVREVTEFEAGRIQGAVNIPIRTLPRNLDKLPADKNAEIVVICVSGLRATYVTMTLRLLGYTNVKTMALGMREWAAQNFPVVK